MRQPIRVDGKHPALCPCCGEEICEILSVNTDADSPLFGDCVERGRFREHWTQLELLLSDGMVTHVECCADCAATLEPEDYQAIWTAVIAYETRVALARRRTPSAVKMTVGRLARVFPIALLRRRRWDESCGDLAMDRR